MKFPVFFRILAVFNTLGSLLLLSVLIVMSTSQGALVNISPHSFAQLWFAALWLLAISFAWFFASRQSYGLLVINFICALAIGAIVILVGWTQIEERQRDGSAIIIIALIPAIYSLFNLLGIFYKPIREWAKSVGPDGLWKANRGAAIAGVLSIVLCGSSGFLFQSYRPNEYEVVSTQLVYSKNDTTTLFRGYFPFDILPGENIDLPMTDTACFDAVRISISSSEQRPWTSARLVDGSGKEQNLSFKRIGDYYMATVRATCSDRITIYTPSQSQDSVPYTAAGIQLIRHYSPFEEAPSDYATVLPSEGDDEFYEPEVEYGEPRISSAEVPNLIERTMNFLLRDLSWNFEASEEDDGGWAGPEGNRVGLYAHGLASMRETAVQVISEYLGGDYIREDYISEVIGRPLFNESPANPYNQDLVPFRKVNPDAINWIASNLIPDPSTELQVEGSPTVATIYSENFQRIGRLLVETHQFLAYSGEAGILKTEYEEAMDDDGFHGPSWLEEKFENVLVDKYGPEYTTATFGKPLPPQMIGFWLRREMDGSADTIWSALQDFMKVYDEQWFNETMQGWQANEGDI